MKIGLDFDGVIINWAQLKSDCIKLLFNVNLSPKNTCRSFAVRQKILYEHEYDEMLKFLYENEAAFQLMRPMPGAITFIKILLAQNNDIKIVTARSSRALNLKEWFNKFKIDVPIKYTAGAKKDVASNGLDIFLDDDYRHLKHLVGVVPKLFLMSWWYNEHESLHASCARVYSWEDFYNRILLL